MKKVTVGGYEITEPVLSNGKKLSDTTVKQLVKAGFLKREDAAKRIGLTNSGDIDTQLSALGLCGVAKFRVDEKGNRQVVPSTRAFYWEPEVEKVKERLGKKAKKSRTVSANSTPVKSETQYATVEDMAELRGMMKTVLSKLEPTQPATT